MKIAVIGSGISGLSAALAVRDHQVKIFEKNSIGGHSRTLKVDGNFIDTGFIVFNFHNYPNLTKLFRYLDVDIVKSDMSFGVSINRGQLEYGTKNLIDIFAQKSNLASPKFYRMLYDINKFNKLAYSYIQDNQNASIRDLLTKLNLGEWFQKYYLFAMAGSIWSSPAASIENFPAQTLINFFHNHGLLTINNQPQWYTVKDGSQQYINKLLSKLGDTELINSGVTCVERGKNLVYVTDESGVTREFDTVIMASHSDESLALIKNPSIEEQRILGAIKYQPNKIVTHSDTNFMPRNKKAWASWVYLSDTIEESPKISLSYWMNNLQPIKSNQNYFVTLNPATDPKHVHDIHEFSHPVFDTAAILAQKSLSKIQGKDRIWFCGAWQKYGFHEDGITSGLNVAKALGADIPWI